MTDTALKTNVQRALDSEASFDASDIGVSVDEGVVTLRGNVSCREDKLSAERVVHDVIGVKAVANDLAVHVPSAFQHTDTEIAQAAVTALEWNRTVPTGAIAVSVANGRVTLTGTVAWEHQREAAVNAVRGLVGVTGVNDQVALAARFSPSDVRDQIEATFTRNAKIDARRIRVTAVDGKVILTGNVRSWAERTEAARAAWATPGVREVVDHLAVVP